MTVFDEQAGQYSEQNPVLVNHATDLAYVIYTSGSTGNPKGCMLQHRGVVNRIDWMWHHYGFSSQDVILQKTTYSFDVSVWELFLPLCWGVPMVLCQKEDVTSPERIAALIERHGVTCLHFVPSLLSVFMAELFQDNRVAERLASLRKVFTSGEALPLKTIRKWYARLDTPVHNLYGPTEASVDVTYFATSPHDTTIPIGRPIWNTQLYIVGPRNELLPLGVAGEICIGGDGLARGYLNQPELTAEKFVANPFRAGERIYRSGDLGRWLADGNIEYLGRNDMQVKVRGLRIELGEIEAALQQLEHIDAAVVLARSSLTGELELVAYLLSAAELVIANIRAGLSERLPAYMLPNHFVSVAQWPLTPSGKIDRKRLPDPESSRLSGSAEYVPARNDLENRLILIWEELLGREKIGVRDDFFELGGHSLKIMQLLSRINTAFQVRIGIQDVFAEPTIENLASHIDFILSQNTHKQNKEALIEIEL
ncbi:amino acid adenylation domain-containing protein [Hymenobacter rubripertinctus]|uniref:Amino acid adenylation domain-containing protein n=1 Tax=Hymenobacter rubripertinctus TaxID=2029981 RepID=A0A418QHN1_9BACT|nr:amino acid adenylation domain-containing protein [Hymenobacter rubripertinctus]